MSLLSQFQKYDVGAKAWREIYQKLDVQSTNLMRKNKLSTKIAVSRMNLDKNRYTNVLPYDQNRVKLLGDSDYINASFVAVPDANRNYILSQGPVEESLVDFWQMIWENDVPAIVMLNRIFEGGSLKCEKYYPCAQNPEMQFGHFIVRLEKENKLQNFISRKFTVKDTPSGDERTVLHIQYTEWPDFGVPESTAHFLEMLDHIKSLQVLSIDSDDPPVVVHCSAGIGRSGTFVLVDSVLRMTELNVAEEDIHPNDLLVELRSQRMGLIQTPEQLKFAWTAIVDGLQKGHARGDVVDKVSATSSNGVTKKRKSATQEELDEKVSKRREMISAMVRNSRQTEDARRNSPANLLSSKSLLIGGVLAVASIFAYYYFRH